MSKSGITLISIFQNHAKEKQPYNIFKKAFPKPLK